jgi:uncharacterized protein (DUF488 family)
VEIFTIGFTKTTAENFFGRLKSNRIERLLDVRLNNRSQLAGFAKRDDLEYFLRELVGASYEEAPLLAPSQDILDAYKRKGEMSWADYEERFISLMRERSIEVKLDPGGFERARTVLLCSEAKSDHCHRRLVVEYLAEHWKVGPTRIGPSGRRARTSRLHRRGAATQTPRCRALQLSGEAQRSSPAGERAD